MQADIPATTESLMPQEIEYLGYKIRVTADFQFRADLEDAGWHNNLAGAKTDIDKELTRLNLLDKDKRSIEALSEFGDEVTVTGIHRGTSDLVAIMSDGSKMTKRAYVFYPRVPWIRDAIKQHGDLLRQMKEIEAKLSPYAVKKDVGYGRLPADKYEQKMNEVEAEFTKKVMAANDVAPGKGEDTVKDAAGDRTMYSRKP